MDIVLRGVVRFLEDGRAIWEGDWGMNIASLSENKDELQGFRYVCENHESFAVGKVLNFRGYFEVKSSKKNRSQFSEKKLEIEILEDEGDNRNVRGNGSNRFGTFVLRGTFNPKTSTMEVNRTYAKPKSIGCSTIS